jgi:hypothetical protein
MKRVSAAVVLSVAILFGAAGCQNGPSGSEVEATEAPAFRPSQPPAGATETDADVADTEVTEADAESATGEATQARPSPEEDLQSIEFGTEMVPQSDDRLLERSDLADLDNWGLTLARNEIFARHGRSFINEHLLAYFTGQPWYTPDPNYERAWLSTIEEANANFILEYQKLKYEIPARHPR